MCEGMLKGIMTMDQQGIPDFEARREFVVHHLRLFI